VPDVGAVVAIVLIVLALAWVAAYAHPVTRPVARIVALPVFGLVAALGALLAVGRLARQSPRPRRDRIAAPPPGAADHGGATGYVRRVEADEADAAERAETQALVEQAARTGDATPLIERERALRARLGLPPLD
jgi:hypothetical protein